MEYEDFLRGLEIGYFKRKQRIPNEETLNEYSIVSQEERKNELFQNILDLKNQEKAERVKITNDKNQKVPQSIIIPPLNKRKLFVTNINKRTTVAKLRKHFSSFGMVTNCYILTNKIPSKFGWIKESKGVGFVEFSTEKEASRAVAMSGFTRLDNLYLKIKYSKPKRNTQRNSNPNIQNQNSSKIISYSNGSALYDSKTKGNGSNLKKNEKQEELEERIEKLKKKIEHQETALNQKTKEIEEKDKELEELSKRIGFLSKSRNIDLCTKTELEELLEQNRRIEEELKKESKKIQNLITIKIEEENEKFLCQICVENKIDTVLSCGHVFCHKCLDKIKSANNICPKCRKHIDHNSLTKIFI